MRKPLSAVLTAISAALIAATVTVKAHAGIFDLPSFIESGEWSIGLEPEISISNGTGAALNLKPRYGVNDLLDIQGIIGTGAGARRFRIGFIADFEWFPDYESQPGIATPFFIEYYRVDDDGQLIWGVKPLIYKTFEGQSAEYTPFIAVPLGWGLRRSEVTGFVQVAMGSVFKLPDVEHWRFTLEAGFNVSGAYSYLSGGVTYYH